MTDDWDRDYSLCIQISLASSQPAWRQGLSLYEYVLLVLNTMDRMMDGGWIEQLKENSM